MTQRIFFICALSLWVGVSQAQINRYWVQFKDKENVEAWLSRPSDFLSKKSIERRVHNLVAIAEEDVPVSATYIKELKDKGAQVLYSLKWFNGAVAAFEKSLINDVTKLSFVTDVKLIGPGEHPVGVPFIKPSNDYYKHGNAYYESYHRLLGIHCMHEDGYKGQGVEVAIFDAGFDGVNTIPMFKADQIIGIHYVASNSTLQMDSNTHGMHVFTLLGADGLGFLGGVPNANYHLFETEYPKTEYLIEEYNWARAAEMADSIGVQVINSSLGYDNFDDASMDYDEIDDLDGKTAISTKAASFAAQKGIIVVVSAGNSDIWHRISVPADADDILTVGAINADSTIARFSSVGPTSDGRIKPDVVAPGVSIPFYTPSGKIIIKNGTSFSSPLVASLAAGLVQAYPELTAKEIIETIKKSSSQSNTPDNIFGYGIPSYLTFKELRSPTLPTSYNLAIFPNPVYDQLTVLWKTDQYAPKIVAVYDILGREMPNVLTVECGNKLLIDVSQLSNAYYFLRVTTNSAVVVNKFIKY